MEFRQLESENQLREIAEAAGNQVIFKHNTTCPISKDMLKKFTREADVLPVGTTVYVLDLLNYRHLSDSIAEEFNVVHESPQLLFIKEGECLYDQSLYGISAEETAEAIRENE